MELNLAPNVRSEIQQFKSVTKKKSSGSPLQQKSTHEAKTVHCSRLSRIGKLLEKHSRRTLKQPCCKTGDIKFIKEKFSGMHCKNVQVAFQHFPAEKLVKPGPAKDTAPSVVHHFIND